MTQDVAGNETVENVARIEESGSNGHIPTDAELDKLFNQDEDNRPQWMRDSIQSLAELDAEPIPELEWIVPDLLAEGMTVLAGYFKSGKSIIILNIGVAIASGGLVLGETKVEPGRVLYITMDDKHRARIRARIRKLRKGDTSEIPLDVTTKWAPLDGNKSDRNGTDDLVEYMNFYPDTKLIIIDVLMNVLPDVKEGEKAYADIYDKLQRAKDEAQKHHVALVLVMHTKKTDNQNNGSNPRSAIYGSQAYGAIADNLLIIEENYDTHQRFLLLYGKDLDEKRFALEYEPNTDTYTYGTERMSELKAKKDSRNVELIVTGSPGMIRKELMDVLTSTGLSESAASQRISRAMSDGKIANIEGKVGYYPYAATLPDYDAD